MPNHPKRHSSGRAAAGTQAPETPAPEAAAANTTAQASPPPAAATPPPPGSPAPPAQQPPASLKITDLKDLSIQKLTQIAKEKNVAGATGMRKQDLIFQILKAQTE